MRRTGGWLKFVNDIPLTWKFILIYLLCIFVPILTINALFFQQVSQNVQTREKNNLQMTLNRASVKVMDYIVGGVTLSHSVATDRSLNEMMDRDFADIVDYYDTYNGLLREKMKPFLSAYPYVERISVFTANETIANGGNYFRLDDAAMNSPWYGKATDSPLSVNLMVYKDKDMQNTRSTREYFSIVRKLNEYPVYGHYAKYLKIDINIGMVDEILRQELPDMNLTIADGSGAVVFPSASFLSGPTSSTSSDGDRLKFGNPLGTASYIQGWSMVGVADSSLFQASTKDSERFIWLLAAVSILVPTSLIFIILRSYNFRIKRLSRHMDKAKDEKFDLILFPEGKDEIGGLIRSYNRMTARIESLINDVYKLEIQQKDMLLERVRAEMKLLQSQMNPHFLFNTLNALLVVSVKNGYTEVTDIIKSLSLLLRRMLSWSDDVVTLKDELHFTEMYLKIEKFRFTDRFDYSLNVSDEAAKCFVPKMCIQPLVENACKHGLQSVKGQRNIRVEAARADAYLWITVEDNGKGIEPERLDEIRDQLNDDGLNADENIGLRNVYRRLKLHYGDRVDLFIESEPNKGTRTRMRFPAMAVSADQGSPINRTGG
ncbi:sensor histidine kinase [Cohnella suwonensis]|uniref:histidine kinase n=1 Tax=Cohnella suwonensis TaxID=696072 RepID=A0ABW0LY95_9BACL